MKKLNIFRIAMLCGGISLMASCKKKEVEPITEVVNVPDTLRRIIVIPNYDPSKGVLSLNFNHHFGDRPLELGREYRSANKSFRFHQIRYWISGVKLIRTDGSIYEVPDSYYFVEKFGGEYYISTTKRDTQYVAPSTREEVIIGNIPVGDYRALTFNVGIDSVKNSNFALKAGELDIDKMYSVASWVWKTSYIFSRVSGVMDSANLQYPFYFEAGANQNLRVITINLTTPLKSRAAKISYLHLKVDVSKVFEGINVVSLPSSQRLPTWAIHNYLAGTKTINASNAPMMSMYSNNVQNMFSFQKVVNQ
ncbi:MAG: hypothetical protein NZM38_04250 [Cytophagales bacterium]|nr:hypothetical protein [Cytophagales bacterium]MDW8383963.1 hypothetical protein [Flammeovirgaceae bacterium]